MKKTMIRSLALCASLLLLLVLSAAASGENAAPVSKLAIDQASFPDENFRSYVKTSFDDDGDGFLSEQERSAVLEIHVTEMGIHSLQGIEHFPALEVLSCGYNYLTALDMSKNPALTDLYCDDNPLTSLNLRNNAKLENLSCFGDMLTSLDLSNNPALEYVFCSSNQLTSLILGNNSSLISLYSDFNHLTALDVSGCPSLDILTCYGNQLTSLNLNAQQKLESLDCGDNRLTSLDLSNCPALSYLSCSSNQLTSLDVSGNPSLRSLTAYFNRLAVSAEGGTFDLSSLPGFDASKASDWQGATVTGNTLTVPASGEVTYTYACGNERSVDFTLEVTVTSASPENPVNKPGNVTGDEKGSVNGADVLRLARFLSGDDVQVNMKAADVTGDGKVDGRDLLRLCRYLAGDNVQLKVSPLD